MCHINYFITLCPLVLGIFGLYLLVKYIFWLSPYGLGGSQENSGVPVNLLSSLGLAFYATYPYIITLGLLRWPLVWLRELWHLEWVYTTIKVIPSVCWFLLPPLGGGLLMLSLRLISSMVSWWLTHRRRPRLPWLYTFHLWFLTRSTYRKFCYALHS